MEPAVVKDERGTALFLAIVLSGVLAAAAAAAALTARTETLIAASYARGAEGLYAAQGGLTVAVARLGDAPDWTPALAAGSLFSEPLSGWLPEGRIESRFLVTVRITDDPADNDGDPRADSNGVVVVHSSALGPGGSRRAVRGLVQRGGDAAGEAARLLAVHETR
jgi:hypothetical protein